MTGSPARIGRFGRVARLAVLGSAGLALAACAGNVAGNQTAVRSHAVGTHAAAEAPEVGRSASAPPQPAQTAARAVPDRNDAAAAAPDAPEKTLRKIKAAGYSAVGTASWYGPGFHGRRTALGETYDMHALTAAHRTLPLPSTVRVTNLVNSRSITLRVNDRGPYVGGRVIDVSAKAAQVLGFHGKGLARVKVDYVGPAPRARRTVAAATGTE